MAASVTAARLVMIPLLLFGGSACAGMETLSDVLAPRGGVYGSERDLTGEIRAVDTRRQEIQIESGFGRSERVRYDGRTEVVYQQRRYQVRDLERGDLVRVRVEGRGGDLYARRVQVQQSVQDRSGRGQSASRVQRVDGSVRSVDNRRGSFEIRDRRGAVVVVFVDDNVSRADRDRFRRLRRGDRVRFEGELLNQRTFTLRRFL